MMIQNAPWKWFIAIVMLALPVASAHAVFIDLVPVGNTGNTADDTGYGAVGYAYYIGKYEVTAGQYTEFLNAVAATDTYGLYNDDMWTSSLNCGIQQSGSAGTYTYSVANDWANRPVNFVDFWDAARFCNWLHNGQLGPGTTEYGAYHDIGDQSLFGRNAGALFFIPTEDEWYKAAYHQNNGDTGDYFDYPTSSDTAPGYVNDSGNLSGTGTPFAEGGTDPGNYATYNGDGEPAGIGSPYYRTEVGEWENSESPYGTFDQGGNVWEWNETILLDSSRVRRGGSISGDAIHLAALTRDNIDPSYEDPFTGFRVASKAVVPEPGSVAMLTGLAVMGVVWWRRRKAA